MSNETDNKPIVIDIGSGQIKTGFAGETEPSVVVPSLIGQPRHGGVMVGLDPRNIYVGEDALERLGILTPSYPTEYGTVTDWSGLYSILNHTFIKKLQVDTLNHNVLLK